MRAFLIALFVAFLAFDLFLVGRIFYPQILSKQSRRSVEVRSEMGGEPVSIINGTELQKKLDQLNFWGEGRVNLYKRTIEKTTVEHIVFVITDKPQYFGQRVDNGTSLYSYGQAYNTSTKTMEIMIQVHPDYKSKINKAKRNSAMAMYAVFDLAYNYPIKDRGAYDKELAKYINNAPVIFHFGII